jgi:hypothetical protein
MSSSASKDRMQAIYYVKTTGMADFASQACILQNVA